MEWKNITFPNPISTLSPSPKTTPAQRRPDQRRPDVPVEPQRLPQQDVRERRREQRLGGVYQVGVGGVHPFLPEALRVDRVRARHPAGPDDRPDGRADGGTFHFRTSSRERGGDRSEVAQRFAAHFADELRGREMGGPDDVNPATSNTLRNASVEALEAASFNGVVLGA
eukprot:CAMPEP_0172562844 /NCGR_PEP_ID=MMETSP1067-20121228/98641_1 /TAXON_ID=265564 ORGANISM="Thalassiosira punctigera, Strain Tpunct2005C2" /NCGR_SAMPLE_ID=MMETSP1067 /ASSEMBLY_ACC=CAM_ASM_000444 /LENGTH=168 /DNA_ID=CAMNT_0013353159 /DNA_START=43 /DNA_END=552 /DNA_ORIENTATION=+